MPDDPTPGPAGGEAGAAVRDPAGSPGPRVYLSYRYEDSAYVGRLYDDLTARFGTSVQRDVDLAEAGEDWPERITKAVRSTTGEDWPERITKAVRSTEVLVVVIGPRWLVAATNDGQRRLDVADDLARLEIATALKRGIPVIPVLVGGAAMPRAADLPKVIAGLSRRMTVELTDEAWDVGLRRLVDALERTLASPEATEPAAGEAPDQREQSALPDEAPDQREQSALPDEAAPSGHPAPSLLPPARSDFVGRVSELDAILAAFEPEATDPSGHPRVVAILGPPGIGKSSLAVHAAHRLKDRFPDGQLHASLAGRTATSSVLALFLQALGLEPRSLPSEASSLADLYQRQTAGLRLLVVLDGVEEVAQVRPFLPDAEASGVLLTGQSLPAALADDPGADYLHLGAGPGLGTGKLGGTIDVTQIQLGGMPEDEALELLRVEAGPSLADTDPEAARAAVRRLGGVPLAVRLLGRRLREDPAAGVTAHLRSLEETSDDPRVRLRAALGRTYESLPAADRRQFRLLGVLVEPDFDPGLAAAVAGSSIEEATAAAGRLASAELVEPGAEGRYRVRELARPLVVERLDEEESEQEREAARRRATRWLALHGHYQPEPRIARDYWTTEDNLGYGAYADAVASFIRHPETRPPLTIGIKAPWGAGKTSLMRMVQERLDPPADRTTWKPTRLRLTRQARLELSPSAAAPAQAGRRGRLARLLRRGTGPAGAGAGPGGRVSIGELLLRTRERPAADAPNLDALDVEPPASPGLPAPGTDWRPTVWFNPWMYQSGEQIWAGLANEVISQVTERLEPGDRERFWLELNLRRVDRQAVRRRVYRVLAERFVPLAFALAVAALLALAGLLLPWIAPVARGALRFVLPLGAAVGAVAQVLKFLREEAAGPFTRLVREPALAEGSGRLMAQQLEGATSELLHDPGYEARLGFLYLVQTDMKRVLDLVATERRPLVVFVDDLDRCSPGAVAQVIEAINLFLAGEFPNCVFVLAVEPAVVAAHVEVAYKDLVASLARERPAGEWSTLGWRFLEKIVQLPLSLPAPEGGTQVAAYLRSLLGPPAEGIGVPGPAPASAAPGSGAAGAAGRAGAAADGRHDAASGQRDGEAAGARADAVTAAGRGGAAGVPGQDEGAGRVAAPVGGGADARAEADRVAAARAELVRRLEAAIRRRAPTVRTLPAAAREAQEEVLGQAGGQRRRYRIGPEALEAANRVFVDLYSDADALDAIVAAVPDLGSGNPREIKRFVNLFRFYTFVAQQDRLRGGQAPTGQEVAKLAILAIRWPQLLNDFAKPMGADGWTVLAHLEARARDRPGPVAPASGDAPPESADEPGTPAAAAGLGAGPVGPGAWRDALVEAGLVRQGEGAPGEPSWSEQLRRFLASEPGIAAAAERLL